MEIQFANESCLSPSRSSYVSCGLWYTSDATRRIATIRIS